MVRLPYVANIMAAIVLVTQGAMLSAAMAWT